MNWARVRWGDPNVKASLRLKVLLVVGGTLVALTAGLAMLVDTVIFASAEQLEVRKVALNLERVTGALEEELEGLVRSARAYSSWDETYQFMQDGNRRYLTRNYFDAELENLNLKAVVLLNPAGRVMFAKVLNANGTLVPALLNTFRAPPAPDRGLVVSQNQAYLVVNQPILPSDGQGVPRGRLLMARPLSESLVERLAQRARLRLDIQSLGKLPPDLQGIWEQLRVQLQTAQPSPHAGTDLMTAPAILVEPVGQDQVAGYGILRDAGGRPAFLLQIIDTRPIHQQAQLSASYLVATLCISGLGLGAVIVVLMERLVVARVLRLNNFVDQVSASGDISQRLPVSSRDELGRLGEGINHMLDTLARTQEALKTTSQAAEAASEAKSGFVATLSHEIRTPLNAVIGLTQVLLDTDLNPEQRDYVETLRSSGQVLLGIINDILDFSKIEAGRLELDLRDFDLHRCVQETVSLFEQQALAKELDLICEMAPGVPPQVKGDEVRIRQVLVNLIGNALKFTAAGRVRVSVTARQVTNGAYAVQLAVQDTGIGIPQDKLERIFQPFSQADASTTRRFGGTGLGLAICQRLCEAMGGWLRVESEVGRGSIFSFTLVLPGVREPDSLLMGGGPRLDSNLKAAHSLRILLAEDNAVNQKVALRLLQKLGFTADVANNGLEVLRAMEYRIYDLILMDLQMPELDGIATTEAIRRDWPPGRPQIVAMTASALSTDQARCLEVGMDGFLSKPIQVEELGRVLHQCLTTLGER